MPSHLIPRSITLPFKYRITVKQVPYEELLHRACEGSGDWDSESRTIYIEKDLTLPEKRYMLLSMLHHALLDASHWALDAGIAAPGVSAQP